jgi:hypothetical protein
VKRAALIVAVLAAGCPTERGKSPPDAPFDGFFVPHDGFDGGFPPIDAPSSGNPGFAEPAQVVAAWTETAPDTFQSATLDLSCLGVARSDAATTSAVAVTATIRDFQSDNLVPNAMVSAFAGTAVASPFTTQTANGNGVATLTVPSGTKRFGYTISDPNSRPTHIFDQLLAPATSAQAVTLRALSTATAQTLPALIGVSATPNRSIVLGTITDCQGHTLSGTIATVSSFSSVATHLVGADTYYFSETVRLPVRHSQLMSTTKNGLFMVIELPSVTSAFVQVWGFRNASEQSSHTLTLLAELAIPIPAGSALFAAHDPRATQ